MRPPFAVPLLRYGGLTTWIDGNGLQASRDRDEGVVPVLLGLAKAPRRHPGAGLVDGCQAALECCVAVLVFQAATAMATTMAATMTVLITGIVLPMVISSNSMATVDYKSYVHPGTAVAQDHASV